jgi:glycosyltransferase involved in cell wall biosynthesis
LGEAYLKFSPQDEETIYEAMVQIKEHREIREQYRELGFKQVKKYDWARAAKETMEVYGSVIGVDSHKLKRENTR